MRYFILSSLIAVSSALCNAAPQVKWLETTHDFGAFDEDMGNVTADFRLVNTGDEPLVIYAARASCGCTIPSYTKEPVEPGDTAVVKVVYNPTGRPGKFDKKVKIETNTRPSQSIIDIKGVVIGASNTLRSRFPVEVGRLKLRRDMVPFGEILKGRTKTAFLEGYNQSNDTIVPVISGLPKYITLQTQPSKVPPGEQVTFTFFYNSAGENDWGLTTRNITVSPGSGEDMSKTVSLTAIVNEDFSALSKAELENAPKIAISVNSVDFGTIRRGEKREMEFKIENYGKDNLIVRKISSSSPSVKVKLSKNTIKSGGNATVKVTVDAPGENDDMLNERITLITNAPDRPVSNLRVTGEIK